MLHHFEADAPRPNTQEKKMARTLNEYMRLRVQRLRSEAKGDERAADSLKASARIRYSIAEAIEADINKAEKGNPS